MDLSDLTWPAVESLGPEVPVVFPVAALEQHGGHLPLFTDSLLLAEVVRRARERLAEPVLFAPLLWLGNSDHHLDFPGTLSAPPRAYIDVLCGMLESFLRHGFRRLVVLNGHGGNDVPGKQALFEVRQRHRDRSDLLLLFATYWELAPRAAQAHPALVQRSMGHACEWETSMMLRLDRDQVGDIASLEPVEMSGSFEPATRGWTTRDRTAPGHIGDPRAATAEKGEALFRAFSGGVIDLLSRAAAWKGTPWEA
jgi:creatinine amidohydrolase